MSSDADFDDIPLEPSESLDSDEIRNDDGDEVADPPERWIEAKEDETLDERLADEEPDVTVDTDTEAANPTDGATETHDSDGGGGLELVDNDELERLDTQRHGTEHGQIDGTPEDGESFFQIVE